MWSIIYAHYAVLLSAVSPSTCDSGELFHWTTASPCDYNKTPTICNKDSSYLNLHLLSRPERKSTLYIFPSTILWLTNQRTRTIITFLHTASHIFLFRRPFSVSATATLSPMIYYFRRPGWIYLEKLKEKKRIVKRSAANFFYSVPLILWLLQKSDFSCENSILCLC